MMNSTLIRCFVPMLYISISWINRYYAHAFAAATNVNNNNNNCWISSEDVRKIALGEVAVIPNFVPNELVTRMRKDAQQLQKNGYFRPDGLSNYSKGGTKSQGFTPKADRQTFRGNGGATITQSWYNRDLGDYQSRLDFDRLMCSVRNQLSNELNRPTLVASAATSSVTSSSTSTVSLSDEARQQQQQQQGRHEITYNWYEPGAKLGQHLDEHHEETKGPKGWIFPSRRSVTWLVYLNEEWTNEEGGALRCLPRRSSTTNNDNDKGPVGCHEGNLQVGWLDGTNPIYLDAFRDSGRTALYSCRRRLLRPGDGDGDGDPTRSSCPPYDYERIYVSQTDFDIPVQPIELDKYLLPKFKSRFEQISTASIDPRFVSAQKAGTTVAIAATTHTSKASSNSNELHVLPNGGTLVLFDSVTLPHSVLEVTGNRQRIAATGWFHEDSQFTFQA